MFNKKYKTRIKELEDLIKNMNREWKKEKKLYTTKVMNRWLKQKVDYVIKDTCLSSGKEIRKPIYGITHEEAIKITTLIFVELHKRGYTNTCNFYYSSSNECFIIDLIIE